MKIILLIFLMQNGITNNTAYEVDTVIRETLDRLEISGVNIVVTEREILGYDFNGFVNRGPQNIYYITLESRLKPKLLKRTLEHELIHVHQYHTGKLIKVNKHKMIYEGRDYSVSDYPRLPYEYEAIKGIDKYLKRIE